MWLEASAKVEKRDERTQGRRRYLPIHTIRLYMVLFVDIMDLDVMMMMMTFSVDLQVVR
jgi:hypothetical protein